MDQWREEIANVEINEIQEGQNGEASTLIATGRGKQLTDVIQAQIKQDADTETALLAIRNDVLSDQLDNIRWLALGSLILGFLFCALALAVVKRTWPSPLDWQRVG